MRLGETYLPDESLPAFRTLMKRVSKHEGNRNWLVHSVYGAGDDGGNTLIRERFPENSWEPEFTPLSVKEANEKVQALMALGHDCQQFWSTLLVNVRPKLHRAPRPEGSG